MSVPVYKASLAETSLADILKRVAFYRVPGTISCRRDGALVLLLTDEGELVFAGAGGDPLGHLLKLLRDEGVDPAELEQARLELETRGRSIGATLVSRGVIPSRDLLQMVRDEVIRVFASVFEWDAGEVDFTPGPVQPPVRLAIPVHRAILDAIRRTSRIKPLLATIGSRTSLLERSELDPEVALHEDEQAILQSIDGKRSLGEVVEGAPLSPGQNGRILYGLFALGLLRARTRQVRVKMKVNE
jgi:hypothetical protein